MCCEFFLRRCSCLLPWILSIQLLLPLPLLCHPLWVQMLLLKLRCAVLTVHHWLSLRSRCRSVMLENCWQRMMVNGHHSQNIWSLSLWCVASMSMSLIHWIFLISLWNLMHFGIFLMLGLSESERNLADDDIAAKALWEYLQSWHGGAGPVQQVQSLQEALTTKCTPAEVVTKTIDRIFKKVDWASSVLSLKTSWNPLQRYHSSLTTVCMPMRDQ